MELVSYDYSFQYLISLVE